MDLNPNINEHWTLEGVEDYEGRPIDYESWLYAQNYAERTVKEYMRFYNKIKYESFDQRLVDKLLIEHRGQEVFRAFLKNYIRFLRRYDIEVYKIGGRPKKRKLVFWTEDKILELIDKLTKHEDKLLIKLFFESGLRANELINIKFEDVDFNNCRVKGIGKGKKPFDIKIMPETRDMILFLYANKQPKDKIFRWGSNRALWNWFNRTVPELVGEKLRPHVLRHSFCTFLYQKGIDILELKRLARHEKIDTLSIYTHIDQREVEDKWQKAFSSE